MQHAIEVRFGKNPGLICQWRAEISTNKKNTAESWRVQMSVNWCKLTNPHSSISTKRAIPNTYLANATAREGSQNKRQIRADYSASNDIPTNPQRIQFWLPQAYSFQILPDCIGTNSSEMFSLKLFSMKFMLSLIQFGLQDGHRYEKRK